jgi:hypothetical protein
MRKSLAVILSLLAAPAFAQNVQQSGTVTAKHLPYWVTSGVIGDGGSSADSPISSIGVTNSGGAGICVSSDRQSAAGRNQLCFGASTTGPATISLQNYGTAAAQTLEFVINGVPSTPIFTPAGSVIAGHLASFASQNVLQDSGIATNGTTITVGTWQGSVIGLSYGGTGATNPSDARANLGLGTMAVQNSNTVAITGGTITGMPTPTQLSDVAIKSYVDSIATGLIVLPISALATTAVLPNTPTYANGASGVGATLTAGSNTTLTVDGTAAPLNTVVLVKNQASAFQNGIYTVTTAGSGAAAWVLTRATYFDQAAEMKAGSYTFISTGVNNINTSWVLQTAVATVGTDSLAFNQFSQTGTAVTQVNTSGFLTGGPITTSGTVSGAYQSSLGNILGAL